MFELFLVACIGTNVCEYLAVPYAYESESHCAAQAAVIAGMLHGRYPASGPVTYRYECNPVLAAIVVEEPVVLP
ncbi:MAG: hypothetical protein WD715_02205 [Dongiaceae bacterium]